MNELRSNTKTEAQDNTCLRRVPVAAESDLSMKELETFTGSASLYMELFAKALAKERKEPCPV